MNRRILISAVLTLSLCACGGEEPGPHEEKSFGGRLGDSYKGMLDQAKQGVGHAGETMRRTDQLVGERHQ